MRLAALFHDHAVLQRDQPIPVWGIAGPSQLVTVTLAGRSAAVQSGINGAWLLRLPPLPAGGPHELVASAGGATVTVRDVLVGDVWICSGQSNMEWKLSQTDPLDGESAATDLPQVRLLTVTNSASLTPGQDAIGTWKAANPASLASFSAVGGWFGRKLHRELGVPVGLICTAWGGTRVQAWISRESLVQDPYGQDDLRHFEGYAFSSDRVNAGEYTSMADWERRGAPKDAGNRGLAEGWAAAAFNDGAWKTMPMPSRWQDHGHPGSGVFWFRRTVQVPAGWTGQDLELRLGAIDKHDDTYVNGERVGGLSWDFGPNSWCTHRSYTVPGKLVGADGTLVIAVRARSHAFHGGMIGPGIEMRVARAAAPEADGVPLHGTWRYAIEQDWGVVTPPQAMWGEGNPNTPSILFGSRVAPLLPYGIKGAIWYQGESNASEGAQYRRQMALMIRDWRHRWGQGDFPFLQVQLANFKMKQTEPGGRSEWAELREAQNGAMAAEPNTGIAVIIDVGDAVDIHPRDKHTVGMRLARWALATTYGRGGLPSGPLYAGATVEAGGRMRIRFAHATGLRTRDGKPLRNLAIAGLDRVFHWAESAIEGETLVVWSPQVMRPASVRYAWADNPEGCNLGNADDLPASPFRTDAWER